MDLKGIRLHYLIFQTGQEYHKSKQEKAIVGEMKQAARGVVAACWLEVLGYPRHYCSTSTALGYTRESPFPREAALATLSSSSVALRLSCWVYTSRTKASCA